MSENGVPLNVRTYYNNEDPYQGIHAQSGAEVIQPYDPSANTDPLSTAVLGVGTLINNVLISHPCTVLRRQCQVHQFAKRHHFTPFTLVPVVGQIITKDGFLALWKGSIGTGVLCGIFKVTEIVIADLCGFPKNLVPNGSAEKFWKHVYLKAATFLIATPFIIASFIETVRSTTGFNITENNVLDVLYQGAKRLKMDVFGAKDGNRRFTVFYLSLPTVIFGTSRFLISNWIYERVYNMARKYVSRKPIIERTRFHAILPELLGTMLSTALSDLACYPFETVIHRLYIQGTRTLIDNLDTGSSATSLTFKYTGFVDCFRSIVHREGFGSLYSGIGALGLQYTLQFLVLRAIREIFDYTSNQLRPPHGPTYIPTTSPVSGIIGQQANNGPSAQFTTLASTPTSDADPITAFPSFAQTSQSAGFWNGSYRSPPTTRKTYSHDPLFNTSPTSYSDLNPNSR